MSKNGHAWPEPGAPHSLPPGAVVPLLGAGPVIPCPSGVVPPKRFPGDPDPMPLAGIHVIVVGQDEGKLNLKNCAVCGGYGLVMLSPRAELRPLAFGPPPTNG
jgi:hypothetical protein